MQNFTRLLVWMAMLGVVAFVTCLALGLPLEWSLGGAVFAMAIPSFTPSLTDPRASSLFYPTVVVSTLSTAGALTYTAAQVLGGLFLRDPNGAARTDTLPTAALLAAAIQGVFVGLSFQFTIRNTADAAETLTIAAGTGGTMTGTATIAQSNSKRFLVVFTNVTAGSEAYDCHSLGTVVH